MSIFPDSSVGKESSCNAGDPGSIPGLGRSPEVRERLPTPVENSMDWGSWWATVLGVAKSRHNWVTSLSFSPTPIFLGFPCGSAGKESTYNAGDLGLIPGLRRFSGEGKGYPLQYSGLESSMDCLVHGVAKSQTQLSQFHSLLWVPYSSWYSTVLSTMSYSK